MAQFKGDVAFSMFMIPNIVKGYLQGLLAKMPSKEYVYTYLGNHKGSLSNPAEAAFGPWLGQNTAFIAGIINGTRGGKGYNWTEIEALYNVLMNASLLLPPQTSNTTSPFAKGRGLVTYLGAYSTLAQTLSKTTNVTIQAGISAQMKLLETNMEELLCPSSSSCFQVKNTTTIKALALFITSHLAAGSIAFLDTNEYGLIVTRPVKDLVFGYMMTKLPLPPDYPNGIPVPEILVNATSEADARQKSKATSLHTCDSNSGTPNTWAGYDGKTTIPQSYFPNAPSSQLKIAGYHNAQFTATEKLSPCTNKYPATAPHFDIFFSPIYQQLRVTYQKTEDIHGIHLNRYILDEQKLKTNNITVFMDGIIDISNIRGIPVSVSAPGFLYGHSSLHQQLSMAEPTFVKYGSNIDIDPVTGKPLNVKIRIQINSLITHDIISAKRLRPLNMTFYETGKPYTKHFPLFWTEDGGALTKVDAEYLQDELFSYFTISCTITMVLPIIGAILLLVGLILLAFALKKKYGSSVSSVEDDGTTA